MHMPVHTCVCLPICTNVCSQANKYTTCLHIHLHAHTYELPLHADTPSRVFMEQLSHLFIHLFMFWGWDTWVEVGTVINTLNINTTNINTIITT